MRAQIESLRGLSAHGDKDELLRWMKEGKGNPKRVKIVHGEPEAASIFAKTLQDELKLDATPAEHLEEIEI